MSGQVSAETIVLEVKKGVPSGTVIPKPAARADFFVKGWRTRRGEEALVYTIPNRKEPSRPCEKGITASEWRIAADRLATSGEFTRRWFERSMSACSKEGGCNFTTIGGIFEFLGYASYRRGVYRARIG